jgi:hypothetical protein
MGRRCGVRTDSNSYRFVLFKLFPFSTPDVMHLYILRDHIGNFCGFYSFALFIYHQIMVLASFVGGRIVPRFQELTSEKLGKVFLPPLLSMLFLL